MKKKTRNRRRRNPIAKAVQKIKPTIVPDKREKLLDKAKKRDYVEGTSTGLSD